MRPSVRRAAVLAVLVVGATGAAPAAAAAPSAWPAARDGTVRADTLTGTAHADYLRGHEAPDKLFGLGGDDLLTGDTGGDAISGGLGDDTITGAAGGDDLHGDEGADVILGGFGGDLIDGGPGDDTLDGANDSDFVDGGEGDDLIHGGSGRDFLNGGAGNDRIYGDSGPDIVGGGDGDDVIVLDATAYTQTVCGAGDDTVYYLRPPGVPARDLRGTHRDDCEHVYLADAAVDPNIGPTYLASVHGGAHVGTEKDDLLLGGPGPDQLTGLGGNDVLWGLRDARLASTAPDVLDAGPGDDTIYGGPGPQRIDAGPGDDFVNGGLGKGVIAAGSGNDVVRLRGDHTNVVDAGPGNDTIYANGPAVGKVRCGSGVDTVYAGHNDAVAADCEHVKANAGPPPGRLPSVRAAAPRPRRATLRYLVGATEATAAQALIAVEFPAVLEAGAQLARRVPRLLVVLGAAARLDLRISGPHGRTVTRLTAPGVAGANAVKIPAAVLGQLPIGRYVLSVSAVTATGARAAQRLPFAVIPYNR